jgi:hypothetical protein
MGGITASRGVLWPKECLLGRGPLSFKLTTGYNSTRICLLDGSKDRNRREERGVVGRVKEGTDEIHYMQEKRGM